MASIGIGRFALISILAVLGASLLASPATAAPLGAQANCGKDDIFNSGLSEASCVTADLSQRASADVNAGEIKVFQFGIGTPGVPATQAAAGYVTQVDFLGVTDPFTVTYTLTVDGVIQGLDGEMKATLIGWSRAGNAPTCIDDVFDCSIGVGDGAVGLWDTGMFNDPPGSLERKVFPTGSGSGQPLAGGTAIELSVDLVVDPAEPIAFFSSYLEALNAFGPGTTIDFFNTATAGLSGLPDGVTFTSPNGFLSAVIPIPAAAWLFGSALGLLGWLKRRVD